MLEEHGKRNKGRPYRTSAGIPFILRYPDKVPKGKIIKSALSSIDFAPSILSLMNAEDHGVEFDGKDFTPELLNDRNMTNYNRIRFTFDTGRTPMWAAAIQRNYKLVISAAGIPWLFDLKADPYEMVNFFDEPSYAIQRDLLLTRLLSTLQKHNIPLVNQTEVIYLSTPECHDAKDRIDITNMTATTCAALDRSSTECSDEKVQELCPSTCGSCCKNSWNKEIWVRGELKSCDNLHGECSKNQVQAFCPETCERYNECTAYRVEKD